MTDGIPRRESLIPGGVNSPVRALRGVGDKSGSITVSRGDGAFLVTDDGRKLIDYVHGWGSIIAGHAHPAVTEAVERAVRDGLGFGMSTKLEERYARVICERTGLDMVRAVNSGTEAAMTAIRLARGCTGRDLIVKFAGGYHGHADAMLVEAGSGSLTLGRPSSAGVPAGAVADTAVLPYNDAKKVREFLATHGEDIAAFIFEPIAGNMNLVIPDDDFVRAICEGCESCGALLVADEVMTGLRASKGLACRDRFGIEPDLACLGKTIGGGLPAAACGGRRELMTRLAPEGDVYQAGTLAGNPIALTAGLATLDLIDDDAFDSLSAACLSLCDGLAAEAKAAGIEFRAHSAGAMAGYFFAADIPSSLAQVQDCDESRFRAFFHEMLTNGVLLPPSMYEACFIGLGHDANVIDSTCKAAKSAFAAIS